MEAKDLIPEIIAFVIGLFLTILGVPSIADMGLMICTPLRDMIYAMPNMPTQGYFIADTTLFGLRLLGAFIEIEAFLRIGLLVLGKMRGD